MTLLPRALRTTLLSFAAAQIFGLALAKEDGSDFDISKASEYKRVDTHFYYRPDLLKMNPGAVIIPKGDYSQQGDSYYFTPKIKAPKTLQFEVYNDWIEPITPPDAPPALAMPPNQMQIREPQGDVEVALPNSPGSFAPVSDGMVLPNGAVLKTSANATAAVLFGGVDSARLMPNSAAAIQQVVTATSRSVEVDLTSGGVFSKVGQQIGVKGEYEVHTPYGNALARGTDFVTIISGTRTDVWIAQGTVSLEPLDSKAALMGTADGSGPLKLIQLPAFSSPKDALADDATTLTAILNFIPMANQKIAALRAKATRGEVLTAGETDYLGRIKQVPSLIKLALAEKAPPVAAAPETPVATAPTPVLREPAAEGSPIATPPPAPAVPAAQALPSPVLTLGPGDLISGLGAGPGTLAGNVLTLQKGLADYAQEHPNQLVVIEKVGSVPADITKKLIAACHEAKVKVRIVKSKTVAMGSPTTAAALTATPATASAPAISAIPATSAVPITPSAAEGTATSAENPAPHMDTAKVAPVALPIPAGPMTVQIHVNGTIKFRGKTITLAEFQASLKSLIKAKPDSELIIKSGAKVPYANLKAVLDSCSDAQVRHITVTDPSPKPPAPGDTSATITNNPDVTTIPTSPSSATNLPTPGLLMHPTMQPSAPAATNASP
jgi:biopolymer transport protein ExbD